MYRIGVFTVSSPFPFRHSTHDLVIVMGGADQGGGTVRVESSQRWSEQAREEIRTKFNVVGDLDAYFRLPFTIEAGDTPVVIPMLNSDESYLETFLRFIVSTTMN